MLEKDYSEQFCELIKSVDWEIELPVEWSDFFQETGENSSYAEEERNNQRLKVRTHGLLWFERSLSFCPRTKDPVGIYTRDFSRHGIGFLAPFQLYPSEEIRVVLPTFWLKLEVVRARRITSRCFEIGSSLILQREPDLEAFDLQTVPAAMSI